ncbi:MAG: LamG-like jellyroll fold domain-containing protein [Chloroflexota bacterium]
MAFLARFIPDTYDCETIAGIWDESRKKRQYCLFLDLPIWDSGDQVGGHVSYHGGPTPNYKYCMDAAIGATPLTYHRWHCVGFTYDGMYARAYLDGRLDEREERNPFHYPQGLFDGGSDGADFTVGAVSRSGEAGNFFHGMLAGLAVYNRALTDDEMMHLMSLLN